MNDPELTSEAVRALNEGRKVEFRDYGNNMPWQICRNSDVGRMITGQFLDADHVRIAPAPKFVPWGINDEIIGRVVRRKGFTERMLITCQTEVGFIVSVGFFPYSEGFEKLEQIDGSPCGKAVQS